MCASEIIASQCWTRYPLVTHCDIASPWMAPGVLDVIGRQPHDVEVTDP